MVCKIPEKQNTIKLNLFIAKCSSIPQSYKNYNNFTFQTMLSKTLLGNPKEPVELGNANACNPNAGIKAVSISIYSGLRNSLPQD